MNTTKEIQIHVHKVRQGGGGREYVVIFDAHFVIFPEDTSIKISLVDATVPTFEDEKELRVHAIEAIREGVESVLRPRGMGAIVEVSNLVVHLIDFIEKKFTEFTIAYLEAALAAENEAGSPSNPTE